MTSALVMDGVNALAGKVVAVGEVLGFRGCLQLSAQADDLAVWMILVGIHPGKQETVHFQVGSITGINARGAHAQVGVIVAAVRRFGHPAGDEGVVVAVVVPAKIERIENRDGRLVACCAEEQEDKE